ncbi:PQQ-binding-like beta-propeller repeat protein [Halorientalis halophila]|uniref:PQQ-binding-like beta-propeller repeat protein n=1 Tax=Halorientalis halophila TaxID=3108499 RepID=UPI00300BC758
MSDDSCEESTGFESTVGDAADDALAVTEAGDWPMRHRDAGNTGHTSAPGPRESVVRGWEFQAEPADGQGAIGHSYPVVDAGTVYVGTYQGRALAALDPATGVVDWRYDALDSGGVPAVVGPSDDRIVVVPGTDGLHGVDAATGERRWVHAVGSFDRNGNVVAADGAVFASGPDGVYAVEVGTGDERWVVDGDAVGAAADGTLVFGDDPLRAVDTADGTVDWEVDDVAPHGSVAVRDGTVFVGEMGRVLGFDLATGDRLWTFEGETEELRTPVVTDSAIVVGSVRTESERDAVAGGTLYVHDRSDGERLWCRSYGERGVYGTAVADGVVYVAAGDVLEARALADGTAIWTDTGGYRDNHSLAVTGDLLVVGSADGRVRAFGEGEAAGTTADSTPTTDA